MRPRAYIVDEYGNVVQYRDAAYAAGVTLQTLYVKISRFRNARGDKEDAYPPDIKLTDLFNRNTREARTYSVIDNRITPNAMTVTQLTIKELVALTGVSRNTVLKRISDWQDYNEPWHLIYLKEFLHLVKHGKPARATIPEENIQSEDVIPSETIMTDEDIERMSQLIEDYPPDE